MQPTSLHNEIYDLMKTYIENKRTHVHKVPKYTTSDNGDLIPDGTQDYTDVRPGADGVDDIVDAIAQAVAEAVIQHLKKNLQLTGGSASFTGQNAAGNWQGAGGGVYGPVTVWSAAGVAGSETLNIDPGKFI